MKTKTAYVCAPEKIEFVEEELPELGAHDILIRTLSVGLCHTDLPTFEYQSYYAFSDLGYRYTRAITAPCPIGHEPLGRVEAVGTEVTRFTVGDLVTGNYHAAFTTYRIVPESSLLVKLPPMDKEPLYCIAEPMGCATNIIHHVFKEPVRSVALIGCGYMNLMIIPVLRHMGVPLVIAVDIRDDKLALAKKYGATHTINSATQDCTRIVYELTDGKFADCVIEMCGSLKGLLTACRIIKFSRTNGAFDGEYNGRGRIFITSVYSGGEVFPPELGSELVTRGPILDASHPLTGEDMLFNNLEAVELYTKNVIPMDELVTHVYRFEELEDAMKMLAHPDKDYIKGVVLFD